MRIAFRYRSAAAAVLLAFGIAIISSPAQTDKTPPPELLQYIRETRRNGFADAKIKSQALAVGWPAATIDEALAYVKSDKPSRASSQAAKGSEPAKAPAPVQMRDVAMEPEAPKPTPATPAVQEPSSGRGVPDDYVIGSGDTLQVSVWKDPELSVPGAVVRTDGKITVPLAKDVEVAGSTPRQAEQKIVEKLKEFVSDPNVTVGVVAVNSKKIYVIGAARKEGPLPYTYGMTVMQALSEAGGLNEYAKRKKIYILHTENGQQYQMGFNYDAVVKGESMEQNILLMPGDTIVIPH